MLLRIVKTNIKQCVHQKIRVRKQDWYWSDGLRSVSMPHRAYSKCLPRAKCRLTIKYYDICTDNAHLIPSVPPVTPILCCQARVQPVESTILMNSICKMSFVKSPWGRGIQVMLNIKTFYLLQNTKHSFPKLEHYTFQGNNLKPKMVHVQSFHESICIA